MNTRVSVSLPGVRAPGAGFDEPFEMLDACHDRVRRSLGLLQRLCDHVHGQGGDADARQAARDVLRYFDIAAPLHHEDEERHVFPPLLARGTPEQAAIVRVLQADHVRMAERWAAARGPLQALADGAIASFTPEHEDAFARFIGCYGDHLRNEDGLVYPAARALLGPEAVQAMGREMAARRGASR